MKLAVNASAINEIITTLIVGHTQLHIICENFQLIIYEEKNYQECLVYIPRIYVLKMPADLPLIPPDTFLVALTKVIFILNTL